jgi:hypothetical protein
MRFHLFEFHDCRRCPSFIREAIVETLGLALRWGRITLAYAPAFEEFLMKGEGRPVMDLCSGSGRPVDHLLSILKSRESLPPVITLSDLFPNRLAMQEVQKRHPLHIDYCAQPFNALTMIPQLSDVGITLLNSFHHFRPPEGQKILQDCINKRLPIFIHESFPRNPLRIFSMLHLLVVAVFTVPFSSPKDRWWKVFGTFFIPLIPLCGLWDGLVSTLRVYSERELRPMLQVEGSENYDWIYQEIPFRPFGRATVFYGVPKKRSDWPNRPEESETGFI